MTSLAPPTVVVGRPQCLMLRRKLQLRPGTRGDHQRSRAERRDDRRRRVGASRRRVDDCSGDRLPGRCQSAVPLMSGRRRVEGDPFQTHLLRRRAPYCSCAYVPPSYRPSLSTLCWERSESETACTQYAGYLTGTSRNSCMRWRVLAVEAPRLSTAVDASVVPEHDPPRPPQRSAFAGGLKWRKLPPVAGEPPHASWYALPDATGKGRSSVSDPRLVGFRRVGRRGHRRSPSRQTAPPAEAQATARCPPAARSTT
jgi:hypothetical protein